jgi:predicted DCC family thiol-disulfide oxidoreductase YuxK
MRIHRPGESDPLPTNAGRGPDHNEIIPVRGWVFYDGKCPLCRRSIVRWGPLFRRRGFDFAPLQMEWVRQRLGLQPGELPAEMKLQLRDGSLFGGVESWVVLARTVWWLWPFAMAVRLPGLHALARGVYRWVAANRYCLGDVCSASHLHAPPAHHGASTVLELP